MSVFICEQCHLAKPIQTSGGTGYADYNGKRICYQCAADIDRQYMIDNGKITLYLTKVDVNPHSMGLDKTGYAVTNWPGTLKIFTGPVRIGRHNWAGKRYDVWFTGPDGKDWHGVTYGDNTQICRCKRVKG